MAKAERIQRLRKEIDALNNRIAAEKDPRKKERLCYRYDAKRSRYTTLLAGRRLSTATKNNLVALSFVAPNFIGFAVFTLVPIVFAFLLAFLEWDGNNPMQWVGLENFRLLLKDKYFLSALKNTIIYVAGTVPLTMLASLGLACLLNRKIFGRGFFRTISFFPYVASLVAITTVFMMLFHPTKGPINWVIENILRQEAPQWYGKGYVLVMLIVFSVWKYMGYYMVIYLAGLQGIPASLYEAAELDGAGAWQKFRYITWPQLRSTTFFVVVMLTINSFKVYDIAVMMAGGSTGKLTEYATVLVYEVYNNAFIKWDLGYSSAIAMVLFAIVLAVTLIQFRGQKDD